MENLRIILSYPFAGLFEYLFIFWLHRHLTSKQVLNSKQSAKGHERIIREILRRSEYFKSDNSSKQASKCDNILDTGGVLDPCNPIVFWVPIFDCCCCKHTLQKKQVCAQLFDLEKCFNICYVYGKRKPM